MSTNIIKCKYYNYELHKLTLFGNSLDKPTVINIIAVNSEYVIKIKHNQHKYKTYLDNSATLMNYNLSCYSTNSTSNGCTAAEKVTYSACCACGAATIACCVCVPFPCNLITGALPCVSTCLLTSKITEDFRM